MSKRSQKKPNGKRGALAKLKNQAGITLLEVMISVVILTIALLGLLGMGVVALEGNQWANNSTRSSQILQQKLEQLRASGNPQSGSETINDMDLNWTVSNAGKYLRSVTVEAKWKNQRNEYVTNSLSTMIKTDSL